MSEDEEKPKIVNGYRIIPANKEYLRRKKQLDRIQKLKAYQKLFEGATQLAFGIFLILLGIIGLYFLVILFL